MPDVAPREEPDRLEARRSWPWAVLMVLLAGLAAGMVVPMLTEHRPPQARQYLNVSACLLTDTGGVVPGAAAAPVWTAMQSASLATRVMVSYLSDTGPSDAPAMLSTLAQRKCGLIIITTAAAVGLAVKAARAYPHQQFLIVAAVRTAAVPANAVLVGPASAPARIAQAIRALSAQA